MSKRPAQFQISKDNFEKEIKDDSGDDDDDGGGVGGDTGQTIKLATPEVLKQRVLLKAKRRHLDDSSTNTTSNVFSGFKGFTSFGQNSNQSKSGSIFGSMFPSGMNTTSAPATTTSTSSSCFSSKLSSFTNINNDSSSKINVNNNNNNKDQNQKDQNEKHLKIVSNATTVESDFSKTFHSKSIPSNTSDLGSGKIDTNDDDNEKSDPEIIATTSFDNTTYLANLRKLNKSFFEHIQQYFINNPKSIYDFTLVCEEYISKCKKLRELSSGREKSEDVMIKSSQNELFSFGSSSSSSSKTAALASSSDFKFPKSPSSSTTTTTTTTMENKVAFNFFSTKSPQEQQQQQSRPSAASQPPFSFVIKPTLTMKSDAIVAGKGDAIQIQTTAKIAGDNNSGGGGGADGANGDDDEQPPKVTSVEHTEEDAIYTKKCKLYYKKDGNFIEKGIGFLYIKHLKDDDGKPMKSKPAQLLIRADTHTGNILLNIALIESLPVIKADKNKGILLTCIPNPPIELKKSNNNNNNNNNNNSNKNDQTNNNDNGSGNNDDKTTVTFLIRVKANDCDELYDNIIKNKKV